MINRYAQASDTKINTKIGRDIRKKLYSSKCNLIVATKEPPKIQTVDLEDIRIF